MHRLEGVANIFFFVFLNAAQAVVCVGPGPSTAATECFDVNSWSWQTQTFSLPSPTGYRASIDLGDTVCLAGGFSGSASTAVHCLNYSSPAWYAAPSLLSARRAPTPIYGPGWFGVAGGGVSGNWERTPRQVSLSWSAVVDNGFVDGDYPLIFNWNGTVQANGMTSAAKLVKTSATTWDWRSGPPVLFPGRQAATIINNPATGLPCAIGGAGLLGSLLLGPDNGPSCLVPNSSGTFGWEVLFSGFPAYPMSIYYARNLSILGMSCIAGGSDGAVARKEVYCINGSAWTRMPDMTVARYSFTTFNYPQPWPTPAPTLSPTLAPTTTSPTLAPITTSPTSAPTTLSPTTLRPTTAQPTTKNPTTSSPTTIHPTTRTPTTLSPTLAPTTLMPTISPTTLSPVTNAPTPEYPTTKVPTLAPTTHAPSTAPTTFSPTTSSPTTIAPSAFPTPYPTTSPTLAPTEFPTASPTLSPTQEPTKSPTIAPSQSPTRGTPQPTLHAPTTRAPTTLTPTTLTPTTAPTSAPTTTQPTPYPSMFPTTMGPTFTSAPTPYTPPTPTRSPTSKAPTVAPTTRAPTTKAPSTAAPTTKTPTTAAPTTLLPTTTAPSLSPTPPPTLLIPPSPSPTLSPTDSTIVWWDVSYPTVFTARSWSTFTINLAPPASRPPSAATQNVSTFTWSFSPPLNSPPPTGLTLQFPTFSFTAGVVYTFTTTLGAAVSQPYSFSVSVTPLQVVLTGGDSSVLANTSLALDASQSYDPDLPQPAAFNTLAFYWTDLTCQYATIISSVTLPQLLLQMGKAETCTVSVIVSTTTASLKAPVRMVASMEVLDVLVSNVAITGPTQLSTSDTLRLLASVTGTSTLHPIIWYAWSVDPSLNTQFNTNTTNCTLPASSSSGIRALSLSGSCFNAGGVYRFSFSASNGKATARAWYTVSAFGIPSYGTCAITPNSGIALQTQFTVTCNGWSQASPVVVSLTYALVIRDSTGTETTITAPQSQPQFLTTLPQINGTLGGRVLVRISGYGGATSTSVLTPVTTTVAITCPLPGSGSLQDLIAAFSATLPAACSPQVIESSWQSMWQQLQAQRIVLQGGKPTDVQLSWYVAGLQTVINSAPATFTTQSAYQDEMIQALKLLSQDVQSQDLAKQVLTLSSLMLPSLKTNCTVSDTALILLAQLVRTATAGNLPSDPAFNVTANGLGVTSNYVFGDSQTQITGGNGVVVDIPSALARQGGQISSLTVASFGGELYNPDCRATKDSNVRVGSGIVDITLASRQGISVGVNNVSGGFSFLMPVNPSSCGQLSCGWWDTVNKDWVTSGCNGSQTDDPNLYRCTCSHLTEFALLLRGENCGRLQVAFLVLLGMFVVLGFVTAVKIGLRVKMGAKSAGVLLWQHSMIFTLCIARALGCASLGSKLAVNWTLATRGAVLVLPYILMFWIYTLMASQWAALFHFGLKYKDNAFLHVRWPFIICNALVCVSIIALLCTFSTSITNEHRQTLANAASSTLAAVTILTALIFIGYAVLIFRFINSSSANRASGQKRCNLNLQAKILISACIVSVLLCVEAAMHAASIASTGVEWEEQSEIVVLLVDWINIVVLLSMYHRAMMLEAPSATPRNSSRINGPGVRESRSSQPGRAIRSSHSSRPGHSIQLSRDSHSRGTMPHAARTTTVHAVSSTSIP